MCSKHLYYEILANHYQDTVICHIDTRTVVSSHQLYTFQPIKQFPDTHRTLTRHLSKSVYMATRHYMSYLGTKNRLLNIFHILGFSSARNLVRIPSRKKFCMVSGGMVRNVHKFFYSVLGPPCGDGTLFPLKK